MESPEIRLDFTKSDFKLENFEGAYLFNVDFSNSKFDECIFDNAIFCSSNLDNVKIINSRAIDTVFGVPELINSILNKRIQFFYLSQQA
ncbi:MAG: pentapeptide repeat-containing protein [Aureispira sp.]